VEISVPCLAATRKLPQHGGMLVYPKEQEIREALLARVDEFCAISGLTISHVSLLALNDTKFLSDVRAGLNFTVDRYQRAQDWLDQHWPNNGDSIPPAQLAEWNRLRRERVVEKRTRKKVVRKKKHRTGS
jgi:hypothetical protein